VFQQEYVQAFAAADEAIIGGVFQKQTDALGESDVFSPQQLVEDLRARGIPARAPASTDAIAAILAEEARPGDVILLMSNGSFGSLRQNLRALYSDRYGISHG
jgi:UDP-N-acetylmuramate: L-alanyl-gamma-D-glutamyl-meso-diaminopimelate ligase